MDEFLSFLNDPIAGHVMQSLVVVTVILLLRMAAVAAIERKQETLSENRRRWVSWIQNGSVIFIIFSLLFVWSPELSNFALSLTAFAVALVIATKEFLLCVLGAIYKTFTRPFEIGDWIEIEGARGEVVFDGMLATRLQELGEGVHRYDYTGRELTIPNSKYLIAPIQNKTFRKNYVYHEFSLTLDHTANIANVKQVLEIGVRSCMEPFAETGRRYWSYIRRQTKIAIPAPEPSILIDTNYLAKVIISVTLFCPTKEAARIEQELKEKALAAAYEDAKAEGA